jgi:hypothetical protein
VPMCILTHLLHCRKPLLLAARETDVKLEMYGSFLTFFQLPVGVHCRVCLVELTEPVFSHEVWIMVLGVVQRADEPCIVTSLGGCTLYCF